MVSSSTWTDQKPHVHLKVGNLDAARAFYADALGFAITNEADGALVMSAGGYHHHLAVNTWGSAGAGAGGARLGLAGFSTESRAGRRRRHH
jgi:catechol 2,3-dioxygenase